MYIYNNLRMEIGCFQYGNKVSDFVGKSIWRSDVFGKKTAMSCLYHPDKTGNTSYKEMIFYEKQNIQKINITHHDSAYDYVLLGVLPGHDSRG